MTVGAAIASIAGAIVNRLKDRRAAQLALALPIVESRRRALEGLSELLFAVTSANGRLHIYRAKGEYTSPINQNAYDTWRNKLRDARAPLMQWLGANRLYFAEAEELLTLIVVLGNHIHEIDFLSAMKDYKAAEKESNEALRATALKLSEEMHLQLYLPPEKQVSLPVTARTAIIGRISQRIADAEAKAMEDANRLLQEKARALPSAED